MNLNNMTVSLCSMSLQLGDNDLHKFFLQYIFDLIKFWLFPFQIKYFDSIMKMFVKPYIFKQKHIKIKKKSIGQRALTLRMRGNIIKGGERHNNSVLQWNNTLP